MSRSSQSTRQYDELTRNGGAVEVQVDLLDQLDILVVVARFHIVAVQHAEHDASGKPDKQINILVQG